MSKICTSRESVFEHLYKLNILTSQHMNEVFLKELQDDFKGVEFKEMSFRKFLFDKEFSYLEIVSQLVLERKREAHLDIAKINGEIQAYVQDHAPRLERAPEEEFPWEAKEVSGGPSAQTENSSGTGNGFATGRRHGPKDIPVISILSDEVKKDSSIQVLSNYSPHQKLLSRLLRRFVNYTSLWAQGSKMIEELFKSSKLYGYNPHEVIAFQRDSEFGLSRLRLTIMRCLKFGGSLPAEDDADLFSDNMGLFDESGCLKGVFKIPPNKQVKAMLTRDVEFLLSRQILSVEEAAFSPVLIYNFRKTSRIDIFSVDEPHRPPLDAKQQHSRETDHTLFNQGPTDSDKDTLSTNICAFFDGYCKDLLMHVRKSGSVEMNNMTKAASSSAYENSSHEAILKGLKTIKFSEKKKNREFGQFTGISKLNSKVEAKVSERSTHVMRASNYDSFTINEIQETDMYVFYTQNNKLLNVLNLKLIESSLDHESVESLQIRRNSFPFFTLNNLRLNELENLLFVTKVELEDRQGKYSEKNEVERGLREFAQEESQSEDIQLKEKFEYKKLREYLYVVKRIELKNRSNSRHAFSAVEEIKAKLDQLQEDSRVTKPDACFNVHLNCVSEIEQRLFIAAALDSMAVFRWLEMFNDIVDINSEKIRKDNRLFLGTRQLVLGLLFPEGQSWPLYKRMFEKGIEAEPETAAFPRDSKFKPSKNSTEKYLGSNLLLNLMDGHYLSANKDSRASSSSFDEFVLGAQDYRWEELSSRLLSFDSPQRTYISKKIFQVRLLVEGTKSKVPEDILPQYMWVHQLIDANRLLDLNIKNMLLMELLNTRDLNDCYSESSKERSSIAVTETHVNAFKIKVKRRDAIPTIPSFLTNKFFRNKPNFDIYRTILKMNAIELQLSSIIAKRDLSMDRYPELDQTHIDDSIQEKSLSVEKQLIMSEGIKLKSCWPDNLVTSLGPSPDETLRNTTSRQPDFSTDTDAGSTSRTVANVDFSRGSKKLMILNQMIDKFRISFFVGDTNQAFSMSYITMREFLSNTVLEEIARVSLLRSQLTKRRRRLQDRSSHEHLIVNLNGIFIDELIRKSYLIEPSSSGEQVVVSKRDLGKLVWSWSENYTNQVEHFLRIKETLYASKIEDLKCSVQENEAAKGMLNFYYNHMLSQFKKVAASKLVLRNSDFIVELDTYARFIQFLNYDNKLMFDKMETNKNFSIRKELSTVASQLKKTNAFYQDYKRVTTDGVIQMIEKEKDEKMNFIK
jgi:hypothetical protein